MTQHRDGAVVNRLQPPARRGPQANVNVRNTVPKRTTRESQAGLGHHTARRGEAKEREDLRVCRRASIDKILVDGNPDALMVEDTIVPSDLLVVETSGDIRRYLVGVDWLEPDVVLERGRVPWVVGLVSVEDRVHAPVAQSTIDRVAEYDDEPCSR